MSQDFRHAPIDSSHEIRVLDLLPSFRQDRPIRCKLRTIRHAYGKHRYEALSYVWGDPTATRRIYLNGRLLHITANCHDALSHLRDPLRTRTLWVDAICIDQSAAGTPERNCQVQLMGAIYYNATRVVVWLGRSAEGTSLCFKLLKLRHALAKRLQPSAPGPNPDSLRSVIDYGVRINIFAWLSDAIPEGELEAQSQHIFHPLFHRMFAKILNKRSECIASYTRLRNHTWFSRVWTVQEVALSRHCIILCGRHRMPWESFSQSAIDDFALQPSVPRDGLYENPLRGRIEAADLLQKAMRQSDDRTLRRGTVRWDDMDHEARLLEIRFLVALCNLDSTQPHDKIYGVGAVLAAMGLSLPMPDYDKPFVQLLEETALVYIRSREKLNILALTLPPAESSGIPSWVPDWNTRSTRDPYTFDSSGTFYPQIDWNASAGSSISLETLRKQDRLGLVLRGKSLGRIGPRPSHIPMEPYPFSAVDHFEAFFQTCRQWCQMVHQIDSYPLNNVRPLDLVRATLGCHSYQRGYPTGVLPPVPDAGYEDWLDVMLHPHSSRARTELTRIGHGPGEYGAIDAMMSLIRAGSDETLESLAGRVRSVQLGFNVGANYVPFILDTGHAGSSFHTCLEGDHVVLLAGSDFPMVLRPKESGGFQVVAPAYVYGAMGGEMWPEDTGLLEEIVVF